MHSKKTPHLVWFPFLHWRLHHDSCLKDLFQHTKGRERSYVETFITCLRVSKEMFANDFKRAIYLGRTPRLILDLTKATPLGETCMSPSSFLKKGKQLKTSLKRTSVNFPGLKKGTNKYSKRCQRTNGNKLWTTKFNTKDKVYLLSEDLEEHIKRWHQTWIHHTYRTKTKTKHLLVQISQC